MSRSIIFVVFHVDMYVCMYVYMYVCIYVCMYVYLYSVKSRKHKSSGSLVMAIKLKAKHVLVIRMTILLLYILRNRYRNRSRIFSDAVLPLSHLRTLMKWCLRRFQVTSSFVRHDIITHLRNKEVRCWSGLQLNNVNVKFGKNPSTGSKVRTRHEHRESKVK
jgi:hypothetical protein